MNKRSPLQPCACGARIHVLRIVTADYGPARPNLADGPSVSPFRNGEGRTNQRVRQHRRLETIGAHVTMAVCMHPADGRACLIVGYRPSARRDFCSAVSPPPKSGRGTTLMPHGTARHAATPRSTTTKETRETETVARDPAVRFTEILRAMSNASSLFPCPVFLLSFFSAFFSSCKCHQFHLPNSYSAGRVRYAWPDLAHWRV
jgi:hypothetical protein